VGRSHSPRPQRGRRPRTGRRTLHPVNADPLPREARGFEQLVERHGREIRLHCYRMLGSIQDADDAAQDALLRAWRGRAAFEGRGSPRSWLYRIATNVCLRALERRRIARRFLPDTLGPSGPFAPLADADRDALWLEPFPDALATELQDPSPGPDVRAEALEAVRLAFVAAIHELPPRQRAVLLLRDVVGLSADETAQAIDSTRSATNSALQRARALLRERFPDGPPEGRLTLAAAEQRLLARYVQTWEAGDIQGLVALLARDAVWTMPPWREWFVGRKPIAAFLAWAWQAGAEGQRLIATAANGQPAFGYYRLARDTGDLERFAIQVIDVAAPSIRAITNFVEPRLFAAFELPSRLPPSRDDRAVPRVSIRVWRQRDRPDSEVPS
jgi:RNA polymerase sigma-70 factor (ECF subfamily)